ncbi:MAG: hypothetical protein ABMB14_36085, partial [Myxococcota bacterium]
MFAIVADRPGAAWLDGGRAAAVGWSILAWDPDEVVTDGRDWPAVGRAMTRSAGPGGPAPFGGGVLGYVGFGAGRHVDAVPAEAPTPEPEVALGRYPGGLCFRHADRTWHAAGTPAFRRAADAILAAAGTLPEPPPPTGVATTVDPAGWQDGVRRVLGWLHDGDCYQVNLSRPVWVTGAGPAFDAYRRLRRAEAAYGAFLRVSDRIAVVSNSP